MMWIWLGLIIVLVLLEIASKNFIGIWFVLGAVVSLILSFFVNNYIIQFLVFVILGSILSLTFREHFIKLINKRKRGKNEK